jgi:peptidoglycan/LPS O-acetylase OafA/YrhL
MPGSGELTADELWNPTALTSNDPQNSKSGVIRSMNFDYIRLFLAVTVLTGHMRWSILQPLPLWGSELAVFCFFCVSGFLITLSCSRRPDDLGGYFIKRAARIYPPIVVTVFVLCAVGMVTGQSQEWIRGAIALLSFQDWLILSERFLAMGVYGHGAFWTLVMEFQFYMFLPAAVLFWMKRPRLALALFAATYAFAGYALSKIDWSSDLSVPFHMSIFTAAHFFIAGALFALYAPTIAERKGFVAVAFPVGLVALYLVQTSGIPYISFALPFVLITLVLAIARLSAITGRKAPWGDLSYGIYIYHFPIGTILGFFDAFSPWAVVILSVLAAFASWHLLERPSIRWASNYIADTGQPERAL